MPDTPETYEDAISQGSKRGLRDLIHNLSGKGLYLIIVFIVGSLLTIWLAGYIWDGFWDGVSSPFRSAWDSATGWMSFGGDETTEATKVVAEPVKPAPEVVPEKKEPGPICSRWTKFNPFCD